MKFKKNIKQGLCTIGIFCVIVFAYTTLRSWMAYSYANKQLEQEHYEEAIDAYGEAIRWYAPLNPWNAQAVKKMQLLAERLEQKGLMGPAKNAYIELRSSLSSVRGIYFPMFAVVTKSSNQYIAILIDELKMLPSSSIDFETLKKKYVLKKDAYHTVLLSFVFILWLISCVLWIIKAFDENGSLHANKISYVWAVSNVFFMGWWLCLLTCL